MQEPRFTLGDQVMKCRSHCQRHASPKDDKAAQAKYLIKKIDQDLEQPAIGHPGFVLAGDRKWIVRRDRVMFGHPLAHAEMPPNVVIGIELNGSEQRQRYRQTIMNSRKQV